MAIAADHATDVYGNRTWDRRRRGFRATIALLPRRASGQNLFSPGRAPASPLLAAAGTRHVLPRRPGHNPSRQGPAPSGPMVRGGAGIIALARVSISAARSGIASATARRPSKAAADVQSSTPSASRPRAARRAPTSHGPPATRSAAATWYAWTYCTMSYPAGGDGTWTMVARVSSMFPGPSAAAAARHTLHSNGVAATAAMLAVTSSGGRGTAAT